MNLINEEVTHNSFGKGNVVSNTESHIEVHFSSGNKKFIFPDAFGTYLTLLDKKAAESIRSLLQKREDENNQKELEIEKEKSLEQEKLQRELNLEKLMKNYKNYSNSQAAFWCEEEDKEKIFTEWRVFTGEIKSGDKQGQPNQPIRLNKNSACLLTSRDSGTSEKDRYVAGIYMVAEDFVGKLCEDGYVPAHHEFKLQLSKEESDKILFWNYYSNKNYPNNMTWNTRKYRYIDNICIAQILRDILILKSDPKERELVQQFIKYYNQLNLIIEKDLPNPDGVLLHSAKAK
ncbi:MAG: hypothetical protein WBI07_13335 [Mobilitalea sp.]